MGTPEQGIGYRNGRRDWRSVIFGVVAGIAALLLLLLGSLHGLISSWYQRWVSSEAEVHHPGMHHWHDAQWGAYGAILLAGGLLAMIVHPRAKPLLLQFVAIGGLILALCDAPYSLSAMILFLPIGLAVVAYPDHRLLLTVASPRPLSRGLLGLTLITAVTLTPVTVRALHAQIVGWRAGDEHALALHWITAVALALALAAAGVLTATRRPGWKSLGFLLGLAYLYLGATALRLPDQDGSWGVSGGIMALTAGLLYIGAVFFMDQRRAAGRDVQPKDQRQGVVAAGS